MLGRRGDDDRSGRTPGPLAPEIVFSVPTSMTVPSDWPAGAAYLGLLVDEFDSISECDETNNTRAIPVTVE